MGSLLLPLPALALVLAAIDALLVRWAHPWRPSEVGLFFHSYLLWAVYGLLALLPAHLTLRWLDARCRPWPARGCDARPWVVLWSWMILPVAAETVLDQHTSLVGFGGLASLRPWFEVGVVLACGGFAVFLLGRWLGNLPGLLTGSIGTTLALLVGLSSSARAVGVSASPDVSRPNLLFLVWDTSRADKLEPYGYGRETTPALARLAEQSLVFEDSLSASTFTFTSHLSMLTGLRPTTHGAHLLDMRFEPEGPESIAQLLAQSGYRTGAFVGTDVLAGRTGLRAGFDVYDDAVDPAVCDTFAWRFLHAVQALGAAFFPSLRFDGRPHWIQDFQRPGDEVLERALAWIRRDDPRPWFCFVNLYDAHWPYLPEGEGARLVRPYGGPVDGFLFRSDAWQPGYSMQPVDKQHISDLYEGELHDLDAITSDFLDALQLERGGTAVLVTSDHGEGLGEGDTWNHDDVREPQVRVPLILRLPQPDPEGRRVSAPASGIDVAPTLLALAGVAAPADIEGQNLLGEVAEGSQRERWVEDRDHVRPDDYRFALYRGDFKLVRFGVGPQARYELYDLARDPAGFKDAQELHPQVFEALMARMQEHIGCADAEDIGVAAANSAAALQALGYTGMD